MQDYVNCVYYICVWQCVGPRSECVCVCGNMGDAEQKAYKKMIAVLQGNSRESYRQLRIARVALVRAKKVYEDAKLTRKLRQSQLLEVLRESDKERKASKAAKASKAGKTGKAKKV